MSFTKEERDEFDLHGLIPPHISNLQEQQTRSYQAFKRKSTDLDKYVYLRDLQDSNETLFYSLVCEHIQEIMPVVYTPGVGAGCQKFSHIYRRPRGLFISYPLRDQMDQILNNPIFDSVEVIVVSDGERILGLGDQGAGGMGIPIGKLALYSACAGIHPKSTLPILLDAGTDNPQLISDPLYIGWRHERVRGDDYNKFIEQFVTAVKKRFPKVLLQWEDFAKDNATKILGKYRDELCTFNDDIQGTASVVLATLLSAVQCTKVPLLEHRIVIAGAGSAGCGIANLIVDEMKCLGDSEQEALSKIFLVDRKGLLTNPAFDFQKKFQRNVSSLTSWEHQDKDSISLLEVVKNARPTVLIGVTGQKGLFNQKLIEAMSSSCPQPIIFPLSNPTSCSEAHPQDIINWSDNRALVGTGSPFGKVKRGSHVFEADQTNNSYIFPGIGLGVIAVQAPKVTDAMFTKASKALAEMSPALKNSKGNLLPSLEDSRKIAFKIAFAVGQEAIESGLVKPMSLDELKNQLIKKMWNPVYLPYRRAGRR